MTGVGDDDDVGVGVGFTAGHGRGVLLALAWERRERRKEAHRRTKAETPHNATAATHWAAAAWAPVLCSAPAAEWRAMSRGTFWNGGG
jgi:hypothetical protein